MKPFNKPFVRILRIALYMALAGSLIALRFRHPSPPAQRPTGGQRITHNAPIGARDRIQALATLREHSAAITSANTAGIVYSGAASPNDILTAYLAAAGYLRCTKVCVPTANGRARRWAAKQLLGDLWQMSVPLADLHVGGVTRIRSEAAAGNQARTVVEFSCSVRKNRLGQAMLAWAGSRHFCGVDYRSRWNGVQSGQAVFSRRREAWKLVEVTSTSGSASPFGVACAMP